MEVTSGLWYFVRGVCREEVAPVGAVAPAPLLSPALSFHVTPLSLFTFWPLSKSTLLGLYRKVVGLISVLHENSNCLQSLTREVQNQCFLCIKSNVDGSKNDILILNLALRGRENLIH